MQQKYTNHDDNNPIGQRLKLEMRKRGISSVDLASKADVKTSFLYDVISGKSANPSSIKLARVAESLGINLSYLAGTSDSPTDGYQFSLPADHAEYIAVARVSVIMNDGTPTMLSKTYTDEPMRFKKDWLQRTCKTSSDSLRLFSVQGDSMTPTLLAGDTLLIDSTLKTPSPPGIFLLFDGLALVVKRLESIPQSTTRMVKVISDNPRYAPYEASIDESNVVGRVVWLSRSL
jgi:phage repressor protein C with HTH and peptisase S24 domain